MNTKTRSALRASLKQEDAALDERLPEAESPAAKTPPDAPVAAPERKPRAPRRVQRWPHPPQSEVRGAENAPGHRFHDRPPQPKPSAAAAPWEACEPRP